MGALREAKPDHQTSPPEEEGRAPQWSGLIHVEWTVFLSTEGGWKCIWTGILWQEHDWAMWNEVSIAGVPNLLAPSALHLLCTTCLWLLHQLHLRSQRLGTPALWDTSILPVLSVSVYMCANSLPSCLILCDPVDCSPPGSSDHGILQARILEWVAMPSSGGSSQPRIWNGISCVPVFQAYSLPLSRGGSPFPYIYTVDKFSA